MGFRFWRRIKIASGLTLNLSKSDGSLSFGPRGAKFTVGSRGKRATVGIPGTGLFYTSTLPSDKSSDRKSPPKRVSQPVVQSEDRLTMGFFKRLITPVEEEAFVDGCRELVLGNEDKALRRKKDRSTELLHTLRYERSLVYEDLGQQKRSRNEFEKLYAKAPDYEDVAVKLGLE